MLENDLRKCIRLTGADYRDRSWLFRIACNAVRLTAPS